jgi:hypothetical protein
MVYQKWRRERYGVKNATTECPACTQMGMLFCGSCLRWLCRRHFPDHLCVFVRLSRAFRTSAKGVAL